MTLEGCFCERVSLIVSLNILLFLSRGCLVKCSMRLDPFDLFHVGPVLVSIGGQQNPCVHLAGCQLFLKREVLLTCVCPFDIAAHAPNSGGRTPGSQTPGDPATLGALDDEELFIVEGSKNWRSSAKIDAKCGEIHHQTVKTLSMTQLRASITRTSATCSPNCNCGTSTEFCTV